MTLGDEFSGSSASPRKRTRILKLDYSGSSPWAVCTHDAVPVILARFTTCEQARQWQSELQLRRPAA